MNTMIRLLIAAAVIGLAGAILFGHQPARGQAASAPQLTPCDPRSLPWAGAAIPLVWAKGSDPVAVSTDKAEGLFVWCQQPSGGWNIVTWQFNLLGVQPKAGWTLSAAFNRARAASDPAAAITAEFAAASVPLADDRQRYEYLRLRHTACVRMTTFPLPVQPPPPANPFTPAAFPNRADGSPWCGNAPTPPVAVAWKTTGGTIFTFASGKLTGVTGRKAAAGITCDCTIKAVVGTTTYCPTTVPTEATACKP